MCSMAIYLTDHASPLCFLFITKKVPFPVQARLISVKKNYFLINLKASTEHVIPNKGRAKVFS